jgi:hypothetical protein
VSGLVALAAFNALSRSRFGALLRIETFLLAVLASMGVDAFFRTVSGTMTLFATVDTLNGGRV